MMGKKERKMCFGICGRVIIGRERGCLGGNFGIGRICVGWRGSGERFLGMRRGLGLGGSGFRFLRGLFFMYVRVFIGATVWRRRHGFSFLVLFPRY